MSRLRNNIARGSAVAVELVPWRGPFADPSADRARALALDLAADPRIDAVSITDGAGGHAVLSPEVLARELIERGQEPMVHVACRDRNRNELLSLGWRLASAGVKNALVVSGDYPVEGYRGVARPVFDIDSVGLLSLYSTLNTGRVPEDIVTRPIARATRRDLPAIGPVRGTGQSAEPTDFLLAAAVNPFKRVERDVVPQYLKLEMKIRAGAGLAITQVGYDARKLDELLRYLAFRNLSLPLLANVFVLGRGAARAFHAGEIPGITVTDALLELVERQASSADKGKVFFLEFAARQVAVARGLGYAGVYLGGSTRHEDYARILDLAGSYSADDWRAFARELRFSPPGTFWFFRDGDANELNGPIPRTRLRRRTIRRADLVYRANRLVHRLAFAPDSTGFRLGATVYGAVERIGAGHLAHVAEQAIKIPLFDCRDCGDCSLPEIAYLCPESQCVKNQRNGPCGGSRDGECEVPGKACIWARAYERLRPYGDEMTMLERPIAIQDNALRRTSAWANTFLGRDHVTGRTMEASRAN